MDTFYKTELGFRTLKLRDLPLNARQRRLLVLIGTDDFSALNTAMKHRIAELYGLVELARANCIHAAAREGADDFITAAAAARLSATEAYDTAARDCVQIHGGIGVTWEIGLHLHMRRARSLAIEQGSSLFWEDVLVDQLAGEAA